MHYTNAVLHESFRLTTLVPFALPHSASKDVTVGKYVIPKGTVIFPCLVKIMRDPDYFEEPEKFKPERFLTADGTFQSSERVIPFSIGKRFCLGQSLAEKEYFLFFTGFMKKFDFDRVPGESLPSYKLEDHPVRGPIRTVPKYNLILTKRS